MDTLPCRSRAAIQRDPRAARAGSGPCPPEAAPRVRRRGGRARPLWPRPAGPPTPARAAPDLNNIAIQQDPAHILRRAASREGPRRAVPQCRRRSRTPCRPARRPLQSRTAPGPAAAGGGSEAPGEQRPTPPPRAARRWDARGPLPVTDSAAEPAAPPRPPRRPPPPSAASSSHPAPAAAGRSSPSRSRQVGTGRTPGARSPLIGTGAAAERRQEHKDGRKERRAGAPR